MRSGEHMMWTRKYMTGRKTIGVVSDTHGWLDPELVDVFDGVDHIVHAGDIGDVEVLERLREVALTTAVKGNIDGGELRFLPVEEILEVNGKRIALLHIAGSPKRPRKAARELLARERPDVLIVGHSHIEVVGRVGSTLWINPGAAGRQGFHHQRTAALLHVEEDGQLALDRVVLGPRSKMAEKM